MMLLKVMAGEAPDPWPQTLLSLVILLNCPLYLVDKNLLLKISHILIARNRDNMEWSWNLPPYCLAFTMLKSSMQAVEFYPSV